MGIAQVAPRSTIAGLVCIAAIAVAGCGTPDPTPTSLSFPDSTVGIAATKDLKITNIAQAGPLTLTSTAISGPDAKMFGDRFQDGTAR